jgi:hypothetical protein
MPIIFNELQQILKNWKSSLKLRKTNFNELIVDHLEENLRKTYLHQINDLFKNIDINDINLNEEYNTSRTYGKLKLVENITIKKKSKM